MSDFPQGSNGRARRRFGDFQFDSATRKLFRDGQLVKIQPQPMRVLEALVQRPGQIVSREELRAFIWGDATFVEFDQGLNYCIRQIRLALHDDAIDPKYVETLPKQGYRFIAPVTGDAGNGILSAAREPSPLALEPLDGVRNSRALLPPAKSVARKWLFMSGLLLAPAVVLVAAVVLVMGGRWLGARKETRPMKVSFVTTYPGDELDPSFSPDGRQVAFSWGGRRNDNRDIYVLPVGGQNPLRLTQHPEEDMSPEWSPDGRSIAFIRRHAGQLASIMLIPALGGSERELYGIHLGQNITGIEQRKLAWSPDGKWLVFTNQRLSGDHALFLLSLETGAARPLFSDHRSQVEDVSPAFSLDGRRLAFARFDSPSTSTLLVQNLTSRLEPEGEPMRVPNAGSNPHSPVWGADARHLLFIDGSGVKQFEIGATVKPVYEAGAQLLGLTFNGNRLIVVRSPNNSDIFAIPLRAGGLSTAGQASSVIVSSSPDSQPRLSPSGKQLAFVSNRSGSEELWLADAEGGKETQVTNLGAHVVGYPRWSPDGRQIAFHARIPNEPQVYVLDVAGGIPHQVTTGVPGSGTPSWSSDGKSLYITKMAPGHSLVYKVPAAGGKEEPLFAGEGAFPIAVPGRKLLLYAKMNKFGIFARSLDEGSASPVEERLIDDYLPPFGGIYPVETGIYYTGFTTSGLARAFRFYSFATKRSVDVAPAPATIQLGLSISPDRRRLVYCADVEGNADLIMLEPQ
jgi:Tol biopolymer transport system component/DNA-binding winged helix-turn-helix (wHTH) protein